MKAFCYFCYLVNKWDLGATEAEALLDATQCEGDDNEPDIAPRNRFTPERQAELQARANAFYASRRG